MTKIPNKTRRVYLYGSYAEKFGSEPLTLAASTVPDLLLALKSILPEWRAHAKNNPNVVVVLSADNKENPQSVDPQLLDMQFGDATEVHLVPAQEGAGIEVAALFGIASGTFAAFVVNTIGSLVISMALGAIVQAIAPTASTSAGSSNQVAANQSFLYNGAVNVQQQGGPVPIVYGYFLVGSTVVSSEIAVEQLLTVPAQALAPADGGGNIQPTSPAAVNWQWTGA